MFRHHRSCMESCWKKVKLSLKSSIPDHSYRMWVHPLEFQSSEENTVRLSCPNAFSRQRVQEHYLGLLESEFGKQGYPGTTILLEVRSNRNRAARGAFAATGLKVNVPPDLPQQMPLPGLDVRQDSGRMLKKDYTFDHFVVGKNSDFAYSASLALAQGGRACNSALYLLADTGLGKSHLSQAVGHHVISRGITDKVYYVTAEDFTNEMVTAIRSNTINGFKEKYRHKCDVLILEDIHFLSGKDATQKELSMTLDYLMDADKKIIFSGCYLPDDIPKMNDQLKSRLTQGLVTKIDVPDFETRVRIVRKKAKTRGYVIPMEVTEFLAQELCDNVRQLESGLNGVATKSSLLGEPMDIDLARSVVATLARNKKQITIEAIKKLICQEYSISEQEIISSSRKKRVVQPRQMAIYLARKYTDQPLKTIGKSFNRYHATAIYSLSAVEKELKQKGPVYEQMNYLYTKIESGRI
ncbi:MAG: chromosomal replication initiator protein DnaA [Pseudomonadota bacterium]